MKLELSERLSNLLLYKQMDVKVTEKEGETYRSTMYMNSSVTYMDENVQFPYVTPPTWGNHFDIRIGSVSYHAGVQEYTESGKWKREGRQTCKLSKLLLHICTQPATLFFTEDIPEDKKPKMIARFVEMLTTFTQKDSSKFELLISDDPQSVYETPTAPIHAGTLGNSCMRPESDCDCHEQSGFYNNMNAHVAYTINSQGELTARALLWKDCYDTDNHVHFDFMDRIYGTEVNIELFKEWAHENGYAHKQQQTYDNPTLITPEGTFINRFRYDNGGTHHGGFPYVDTLKWMKDSYNIVLSSHSGDYELCETDGGDVRNSDDDDYQDEDLEGCHHCGRTINTSSDNYENINGYIYCSECAVYSVEEGESIRMDDAVRSDDFGWLSVDKAVKVEGEGYYPEDHEDVVEVNGKYYLDSDSDIVKVDDNWYLKSSDEVKKCDWCDEYHLTADIKHYEEIEEDLCSGCVAERMSNSGYEFIDDCAWVKVEKTKELEETILITE